MRSTLWNKRNTLDEIERWLMEYNVNVDCHFKAGDRENGISAFEEWHAAVHDWLSEINFGIANEFGRTGAARRIRARPNETIRSRFLRSRGGRPIIYLRKLQKDMLGGAVVIEDLRAPSASGSVNLSVKPPATRVSTAR